MHSNIQIILAAHSVAWLLTHLCNKPMIAKLACLCNLQVTFLGADITGAMAKTRLPVITARFLMVISLFQDWCSFITPSHTQSH